MGGALLETMARRGIVYVTAFTVHRGHRDSLSGDIELGDFERQVPSDVEAENLRRAVRHGVIVAAGSDAGNIGTSHEPGFIASLT